tara:strand:+ start:997 stop:1749 length:753 start_codon:yes stop_codon:yes gene_type:complete
MNNSHSKYIRWTPRLVATTWKQRQAGIPTRKIAAKLGCGPHNLRNVWKRFGYGSTKQIEARELAEIAKRIRHGETLIDIADEMGKTYNNLRMQLKARGFSTRTSIDWGEHIDGIIESRINGVSCNAIAEMMDTSSECVRQALYEHRKRIGVRLEPVWTDEKVEQAHEMKMSGRSFDDIADELGLVSGEAVRKKMRSVGHRYSTGTRWTHARVRSVQTRIRKGATWRQMALDNDVSVSYLRSVLRKKDMLP